MLRRIVVLLVLAGVSVPSAPAQAAPIASLDGRLQLLMHTFPPPLASPGLLTPQLGLGLPAPQLAPHGPHICPVEAGPAPCTGTAYPCAVSGGSPCENQPSMELIASSPLLAVGSAALVDR